MSLGPMRARTSSMPRPSVAEVTTTSAPTTRVASSAAAASGSGCVSALVRTMTGRAPLSQATTSSRSTRLGRTGRSRPVVMRTRSTSAASVCASVVWPAPWRSSCDHRGSTSATRRGVDGSRSSSTQSPTVGSGSCVAVVSSEAVTTRQRSRSTRTTRAGQRSGRSVAATSACTRSLQPWRARSPGNEGEAIEAPSGLGGARRSRVRCGPARRGSDGGCGRAGSPASRRISLPRHLPSSSRAAPNGSPPRLGCAGISACG